jgi:hypothetical protein
MTVVAYRAALMTVASSIAERLPDGVKITPYNRSLEKDFVEGYMLGRESGSVLIRAMRLSVGVAYGGAELMSMLEMDP